MRIRKITTSKIDIFSIIILSFGSVIVAFPFIWMVSTSLKSIKEVYSFPPIFVPETFLWENYSIVWISANFARYFMNSIIVSVLITLGVLITSSLAAYAFARMEFTGKNLLFLMILGFMMIPNSMYLIPNYITISRLGWLDSYLALIVPFLASPLGILILRQHIMTIPKDLEDAACIDGCGSLRFFYKVVLPLSTPSIAVVAVFTFISNWNMYIWPLLVTRSDTKRTIQIGLAAFRAESGTANVNWAYLMAASTMALLPVLIIYLFAQKWFTQGFMSSGIHGQ